MSLLVGTSATVVTAPLPDDLSGITTESLDVSAATFDAVSLVLEVLASRVGEDVPPCRRQNMQQKKMPPSVEDTGHAAKEDAAPSVENEGGTTGGDVPSTRTVVSGVASPRFAII